MSPDGPDQVTPRPPVLRVERGNPTAEELAAVVAVLAAAGGDPGPAQDGPGRRPSLWTARSRFARAPHSAGPGAWRASSLPR